MAVGLTIDSQLLDIEGAWKHNRSLRRLRSTIATKGENGPKPGQHGTTAYGVLLDEVVIDLELIVFGANNAAGTPHADVITGLDTNLAYLDDWVRDHANGTTSTWTASYEAPNGTTYTTGVQVINWQIAQENATQVVIGYDLRIPSGTWT